MATDPLSNPAGSSALLAAVQWLQGTLLGTLATTVAVIAIAWIGFGMLAGRINIQRGATAILGCFIVFGASGIVAGLFRTIQTVGPQTEQPSAMILAPPPPPIITPKPVPYDPYAGASVPVR